MGKRPAARPAPPMWVTAEDLPKSAGHPFFERLNDSGEIQVRRFRGGVVCRLLRGANGSSESATRAVFPASVHRVFRGSVIGALDCVAGRGFAEPAGFPGSGRDRGDAEPLDPVTDSASDRRGSARGGVHVGAGAVVGSGCWLGKTIGVDATTLEANRGDAEHRASGYDGLVRLVRGLAHLALRATRAEFAFHRSRKGRIRRECRVDVFGRTPDGRSQSVGRIWPTRRARWTWRRERSCR